MTAITDPEVLADFAACRDVVDGKCGRHTEEAFEVLRMRLADRLQRHAGRPLVDALLQSMRREAEDVVEERRRQQPPPHPSCDLDKVLRAVRHVVEENWALALTRAGSTGRREWYFAKERWY